MTDAAPAPEPSRPAAPHAAPTAPAAAPAVPTDAAAEPELQPYNFRMPPRVTKERRAALDAVYGRYAKLLEALVTSRLRTPADARLVGIEQKEMAASVSTLANPCAVAVFRLGSDRQGYLDIGLPLAFHLVDRLLGGPGDAAPPPRPLTPLEESVVRGMVERAVALLAEAWAGDLTLAPELESVEGNPDALPFEVGQENVIVARLELRTSSVTGELSVVLPMTALEPFLQEGAPTRALRTPARREENPAQRAAIAALLGRARVDVSARLPGARLATRDVARLRAGDVLHLGHALESPVQLLVNGRLHAVGTLGQQRGRVGLRVTRIVREADASAALPHEGRVL